MERPKNRPPSQKAAKIMKAFNALDIILSLVKQNETLSGVSFWEGRLLSHVHRHLVLRTRKLSMPG